MTDKACKKIKPFIKNAELNYEGFIKSLHLQNNSNTRGIK